MLYLAAWLLPGLGVAGMSIARGYNGFFWFLYVFLAWPLALIQLAVRSKRQAASAAETEAPPRQSADLPAPEPLALPLPATPPESDHGPGPNPGTIPKAAVPTKAAVIELALTLPPARDSLPASAAQLKALEGHGLDPAGHLVTFDQADILEAAARYSAGVFSQTTGQSQVPLPLQVEMINVILRDARLSTRVRRWAIARRALKPSSAGQPEIPQDQTYDAVAEAMIARAPAVAERLERARATSAAGEPAVRFVLKIESAPQGQAKVLARDLKRQMAIAYETLEGTTSEHRIELSELQERDGLLYLRGYWGAALALRQISIDRIQRLTDLETRETPDDPEAYLRETFTTTHD